MGGNESERCAPKNVFLEADNNFSNEDEIVPKVNPNVPISLKRVTPDRVSRAERSRSRSERVSMKKRSNVDSVAKTGSV